ncbi:MAG: hypothetical protein LAT76_07630 [Schleiferiaceae bacterium]|nr:hypothetical protein [Schleiferiaceae bacterium]
MPEIKTLMVTFQNDLQPHEIALFRGAIGNLMRDGSVLFHNHIGDQLRYAYPMIQYKIKGGKAIIVCVNEGADAIYQLLSKGPLQFRIGAREEAFTVATFQQESFVVRLTNRPKLYDLNNWLALNESNYRSFNNLRTNEERVALLERILVNNILDFAKGAGWRIDEQIQVQILEVQKQYPLKHKGVPLLAFNLTFAANVVLPSFIGLGKATSSGHGTVRIKNLKTKNYG